MIIYAIFEKKIKEKKIFFFRCSKRQNASGPVERKPKPTSGIKEKEQDIVRMINQYMKKRLDLSGMNLVERVDVSEDSNGHYSSASVTCPFCLNDSKIKLNIDRSREIPRPTISNFVSHLNTQHLKPIKQIPQTNTMYSYVHVPDQTGQERNELKQATVPLVYDSQTPATAPKNQNY